MRKDSGFSAFELATTIAIVAVITALVMPPYLKWLRAHRLRGAVVNLTADLEMAKVRAIRENRFVVVQFAADNYKIFIDTGDGLGGSPNWEHENADEELVLDRKMPAGVTIDEASLSFPTHSKKTRFNGRGIPPDVVGPETILLANANDSRQITLNRLGNLDVQ